MSEARWRAVAGFPGYEVSDDGRVRIARWCREMPGSPDGNGYVIVVLRRGGRRYSRPVHRIVADAFLPNPDELPLVRHLDDDPTNNTVDNLAWGTHSDNRRDSVRNGTHANARKTHCPESHPYSEENTYQRPGGGRECRTCRRERRAA